jgi:hypothetical protein
VLWVQADRLLSKAGETIGSGARTSAPRDGQAARGGPVEARALGPAADKGPRSATGIVTTQETSSVVSD